MSETANRYTLLYPITTTFKGPDGEREETITELVIRRPVAGDLRVTDSVTGDVAKSLALLARITGVDQRALDKLDTVDLTALGEVIEGFTKAGPQIGKTP